MIKRFKKYLLINVLFQLIIASSVSIDDVITITNNFINERSSEDLKIIDISLEKSENIDFFYIVDIFPSGFILVSANKNSVPIIGFSFKNNLNLNQLPPQLERIIKSYKKNIEEIILNEISSNIYIENLWQKYTNINLINRNFREVVPLITANWDQGGQWNDMCPDQTLVGCVAVAMGQVMYYWGNPSQGEGYTAYFHQNYGPISINFEDYYYDFDNMEDNNATSESQILLYHAGAAVNMDYSHWGSGASVCWEGPSAQDALINHFNFIDDTACDTRINYDDEGWFNNLVEQLDNGWPMIFRGYGENDGPGHAWNVDGYQEGGYIHCNWGWGGSSNGYFYINNLNGGGYNFIENQAVLKNIFPKGIAEPIALFDYDLNDFTATFLNFSDDINENQIVSWMWDFDDGNYSEEHSPIHNYETYGNYEVSLIITDEFGQDSIEHIESIQIIDLTGDINFDNSVNIVDIVTLINLVLESNSNQNTDADLNADGELSILDIVLLVNIILNNQ